MNTNVEVTKKNSESTTNLIRRFTKRVQEAGIIRRVRSIRYSSRPYSAFTRKKSALKRLRKTARNEHLRKMGKM